jgi:amino acid adenylation domain-containing protein/non-ribosomal peptide synthase protein (TIGR01720 family)
MNDAEETVLLLGRELREERSYWIERLQGEVGPSHLWPDHPAQDGGRTGSLPLIFDEETGRRLASLTKGSPFLVYACLAAAFDVCLYRYTGSSSPAFGSPELTDKPATSSNVLTILCPVKSSLSFQRLLVDMRSTLLEAYARQRYPYSSLANDLKRLGIEIPWPVFGVAMWMRGIHAPCPDAGQEVTISFDWNGVRLKGEMEFRADLFSRHTIERLAGHFRRVVSAGVENPSILLRDFEIATEAERHQVLVEANDTARSIREQSPGRCIHAFFEDQARRAPDALAVAFGERHVSYGELNRRSNQLAHHLETLGVGPEVRVGVFLDRSIELFVGLLGTLKAGGGYVPLDPSYPVGRLHFMIEDARMPVVVTIEDYAGRLPQCETTVVLLDAGRMEIRRQSESDPTGRSVSANLAYAIYTSGSTGVPKGVQVQHESLGNLIAWHRDTYRIEADDRATQIAGLSFDASVWEIWPYLTSGASVHLPAEETRVSPERLVEWLSSEAITVTFLSTPLAEAVMEQAWPKLAALRALLTGGDRLRRSAPSELPCALVNHYGPTEGTVVATSAPVARGSGDDPPAIGRPITNVQSYVLDDDGNPLPPGIPGELFIGGHGLARGYLFRAATTAERFVPHPFSPRPGERAYRTGDRCRWRPRSGELEFLGRTDQQIKVLGYRVEPGEVERAMLDHPAVKEAVVIARADSRGSRSLHAYVVPEQDSEHQEASLSRDLIGELEKRLPSFMIPRTIDFLDHFPLTPSGKIDREALPISGKPAVEGVAPRTPVEAELARLWSEVLEVDGIGVHDDFLALGGHSLLAMRLISRIRDSFQVELGLRDLFELRTIEGLAGRIRSAEQGRRPPPILPVPRDRDLPLSFAQQRLWFLDQLVPGNPAYNVPGAVRFHGPLDIACLRRTLDEIVHRHEVLRTTFTVRAGAAVQIIAPTLTLRTPLVDVSELPRRLREEEVRRLAHNETQRPFELSRGPLVRAAILRVDEKEYVVFFTFHHIVADGWSMGVLVREVAALYEAFASGRPSPLPALGIQYADFAYWQREWFQGEVLQEQLDYWRSELDGLPVLNLFTDRPRPLLQTFQGSSLRFAFSEELSGALSSASDREGVTLFMTMLAAFKVLLSRYTGQTDVVVGSGIANRNRPEIEGLVGFFVNMITLRTDLSGDPSFRDLLRRERDVCLSAFAHQDLPFEKLVEEVQPSRDLSREPLFQVVFVMQNFPVSELSLPNELIISPLDMGVHTSKYDLTFHLRHRAHRVGGMIEYNTDLFRAETISRMLDHFRRLLEGITRDPDRRLSEFSILSDAERQMVLWEWAGDTRGAIGSGGIHDRVAAQAALTPDAIAAAFETRALTYGELQRRANRLADYLRSKGVGREDVVAVCLDRSLEWVVALLAVLEASGAYLPLDPSYPEDRLRFMVEDARACVLLTEGKLLESLPKSVAEVVRLEALESTTRRARDFRLGTKIASENLAYVMYTSGSTGIPKGVQVQHGSLNNLVDWHQETYGVTSLDRATQVAGLSFDASVWEVWPYLTAGATLCLVTEEARQSPRRLVEWLTAEGITLSFLPTPLAEAVGNEPWPDLCSLRALLTGGDRLQRPPGEQLPYRLVNHYGPTENTVVATSAPIAPGSGEGAPTIGTPIRGTQVYLLDQDFVPVPIGVPGELCIGGDGLARGYVRRGDLTADRFLPHPFAGRPGERLYRTGDRCRWVAPGLLDFLGRTDHQVKVRGFRIELGEIEAVLRDHPAVREAAVTVREDARGERKLTGYAVPGPGLSALEDEAAKEQVARWAKLYEETYGDSSAEDASFNLVGWESSYTRTPLPAEEMKRWRDDRVEKIFAREPHRVLEIGCGTGLLLTQIAPRCLEYHGTDFSRRALDYIESAVGALPGVSLSQRAAHDFTGLGSRAFDTVILNSVVQYFPSVSYLIEVLEGATRVTRDGGLVFVGDVRNLRLSQAFHTSVELYRAPSALSTAQLRQKVQKSIAAEKELLIDPDFFFALMNRIERICHVEIQLERGRHLNELTKFRYDAILHLDRPPRNVASTSVLDWRRDDLSLEGLEGILAGTEPACLLVQQVPDARVERDLRSAQLLAESDGLETVGALRERLQETSGDRAPVNPEDVWSLAGARYSICISPSSAGFFDVAFWRDGNEGLSPTLLDKPSGPKPWALYANDPLKRAVQQKLAASLRSHLESRLPGFMCPSTVMVLDEFPLTRSGKVDRKALATTAAERPHLESALVAPRNPIESDLARIWSELLHIDPVGVHDDFFALGGHSLLATQLASRVRETFEVELPLRELFEVRTIEGLAQRIRRTRRARQRPPIEPVARDRNLPLSFAQQRLWFLDQLVPGNPFYTEPAAVRLTGALDARALFRTLNEVVARHEVLRTAFTAVDGHPVQIIADELRLRIGTVDLRGLKPEQRESQILRQAAEEAERPFDLTRGPLLRASLLRVRENENVFLLTLHHIVSDGWSLGVLVKEIALLYEAFTRGLPSPLPPLPIQYADFAYWQRHWFRGEVLEEQLSYWREQLRDLPNLQLVADRPRPPEQTFRGATLGFLFPERLLSTLQSLSGAKSVTLFMTTLAAFKALLSRYTGQHDIVVGSAIAGRNQPEIEGLIGFFVNMLTLRTDLTGDPSFDQLLDRVRENCLRAYAHQDLPFEKLVEELQPTRDLSHEPLFQVVFVLQNLPVPTLRLPSDLTLSPVETGRKIAKFDFTLHLREAGERLGGVIEYNTTLFDRETMERLVVHFRTLLEGAAADPDRRLSSLPLLTEEERRAVLEEFPRARGVSSDESLVGCFESRVDEAQQAIALVGPEVQLSYGELNDRAEVVALALRAGGVSRGARVGIFMERTPEMIVSMLGVLKAGAAYVPLDPDYPAERLRFMLQDTDSVAVVTVGRLAPRLETGAFWVLTLDSPEIGHASPNGPREPKPRLTGQDACYVMYTSGSTGRPKGVEVRHGGVARLVLACDFARLTGAETVLHLSSASFDASTFEVWAPLLLGGRLVLAPERVPSIAELGEALSRHRIDTLWLTASLFNAVIDEAPEVLAGVDQLIVGGEALSVPHVRRARRLLPRTRLINGYGPTESTTFACCHAIVPNLPETLRSIPIGRPISERSVYLLDRDMVPVPVGVPGELHVGGAGLARGYVARAALTAERFVPHGHATLPGERLYRTGDRARWLSDGTVEFLGRGDHQIKIRGFRIELEEIQAVLEEHPAVERALVRVSDKPRKRIAAYAVVDPEFRGPDEMLHAEWMEQWKAVYGETYRGLTFGEDPTFNIAGWNSSYSGEPIPREAMREQVDQTVERILALGPTRVLEIGCGTGLLLFRIAPHCLQYTGTDFSRPALRYIERVLEHLGVEGVELVAATADDLEALGPKSFDGVVLNSIVQYFPSLEYLARLIEDAVRHMNDGGFIFIGDVRSLPLLEAFHASVQLHQAPASLSREKLFRRFQQHLAQENELVIDPQFFWELPGRVSQIRRVEVHLKRGNAQNELTRFRYDVILWVSEADPAPSAVRRIDWLEEGLSIAGLQRWLGEEQPENLLVTGIPNARVEEAVEARKRIAAREGAPTVGELRRALRDRSGVEAIDPESVWELAEDLPYEVHLTWSSAGSSSGRYDAAFSRRAVGTSGRRRRAVDFGRQPSAFPRSPHRYATNPLHGLLVQKVAPDVLRFTAERVPEYMVPARLTLLSAFPLSLNGKVDIEALSALDSPQRELDGTLVPPRNAIEKQLVDLWCEVLGVSEVGVHDNFFALGGDSILSIQIIARAHQAGLQLTPRQVFQHQTIAELASLVGRAVPAPAVEAVATGPVPLTPIQRWFFEREPEEPHHFNQAMLLDLRDKLDRSRLSRALAELPLHHDALRMRYERSGGWRQFQPSIDHEVPPTRLHQIDLTGLPEGRRGAALEEAAGMCQRSLDLFQGPLLRAVLFDMGSAGERFLFVVHHLVVDGVSWRILLEDLLMSYQLPAAASAIPLPRKTTPFQAWARRLLSYRDTEDVRRQREFWRSMVATPPRRLPLDSSGRNEVGSSSTVYVELDPEETRALLREVPNAYRTQINEVLLTALASSICEWTSERSMLVDLEGHGREDLFDDVDLSRTVGWFTTLFPIQITIPPASNAGGVLRAVKEQLRRIPDNGIGYGVLRYLGDDTELASELDHRSELSFNYLGQLDQAVPPSMPVRLAPESSGPLQSRRALRPYVLEVGGAVVGRQLRITWTYSRNLHYRETVEKLAASYIRSLRELISHCLASGTSGISPSDFPLVELSQETLERLIGRSRDVEDIYPATPLQSGLLFHTLYAPGVGEYFEQISCTLGGEIQVEAFRGAWQAAVDRHEILRTSFWVDEDLAAPLQVVHRSVALPWEEQDWRGCSPEEQEERLEAFLAEDRRLGFPLALAPLLRVAWIRRAETAWTFVFSFHHVLLDGWSAASLLKEVMFVYEARVRGHDVPLGRPRPYRNYIRWLKSQDREKAETYWRQALSGFRSPTSFAFERPGRSARDGQDYRTHHVAESPLMTQALESLAKGHRLSLNTIVEGAWALALGNFTGEDDLVFGVASSGRPADLRGIESMVGLFVSVLPFRLRIEPGAQLLTWLDSLQQRQAELRDFEYCSLVDIQAWSEAPRERPLFELCFAFENYPLHSSLGEGGGAPASGIKVSDIRARERYHFALTLVCGVVSGSLFLRAHYDRRRLAEETVVGFVEQLRTLLAAMAGNPHRRLSEFPSVDAETYRLLVIDRNRTTRPLPRRTSIHGVFEDRAAEIPDAVALVEGQRQLTYGELNRRADSLAHHLRRIGVGAEQRVALLMGRSIEMLVGILGSLKSGAVCAPLDPQTPQKRLAFLLQDMSPRVLLTDLESPDELLGRDLDIVHLGPRGWSLGDENERTPSTSATGSNLAYVLYTSGSTGTPKGVEITHLGVLRLLFETDYVDLAATETLLHHSSPTFDISTFETWASLLHGGRCVILPDKGPTVTGLAEAIETGAISTLWLTASLFNTIVDEAPESLVGIRQLLVGGEALSVKHIRRALERLPATRIVNGYGPTESTVFACCHPISTPPEETATSIPIGRPIANTRAYVLDHDKRPAPVGVSAELHIGGAGLARGYLSRPRITAEKFIPDPFAPSPGSRLYATGDLCRWRADGELDFVERLDRQVKLRGFRIELGEVEAVLTEHPDVARAAVLVREDRPAEPRLVAYLQVDPDCESDDLVEALGDYSKQRLPHYMIPSDYVFLPELPLGPTGKLDRARLPVPGRPTAEQYVAPRNAHEKLLVSIFEKLFSVRPIGVRDDFFALGGNSLSAMRLLALVEKEFQRTLPLASLFQEAQTIETLARVLEAESGAGEKGSLVKLRASGDKPTHFWIHSGDGSVLSYFELTRQMGPEQPIFGLEALGLDGSREPHATVEEMAAHYVAEIRRSRPRGPYSVGGHSAGGVIAFEVARRLKAEEEEVRPLILLDTPAPHVYHEILRNLALEPGYEEESLRAMAAGLARALGRDPVPLEKLLSSDSDSSVDLLVGAVDASELAPGSRYSVKGFLAVAKAVQQALRAYRPPTVSDLEIVLCLAAAPLPESPPGSRVDDRDRSWGWQDWTSKPVTILTTPGDHFTMLAPPNARELSTVLRGVLERQRIL